MLKEACCLCGNHNPRVFFSWQSNFGERDFLHCPDCGISFVPKKFHPSLAEEKSRYEKHNNDIHDEGYRSFLRNLTDEMMRRIVPSSKGLDYGAGPGPALVNMMREHGFDMTLYDPLFHPDESVLEYQYDFITCTETVEHFRQPMREFRRLDSLLKHEGWLGIMTGMVENLDGFPEWHYHRDITHICFFSEKTFRWLADKMRWHVEFPRRNIVLFKSSSL